MCPNPRLTASELDDYIAREDFFDHMPAMQGLLAEINSMIEKAAKNFLQAQIDQLENRKSRLQALPEWSLLGAEDKTRIGGELDGLKAEATMDIRRYPKNC